MFMWYIIIKCIIIIIILSICARVNTCAHCTHSVHRCSQFTFSSALFDTDEQWSGFLHIINIWLHFPIRTTCNRCWTSEVPDVEAVMQLM